MTPVDVVTWVKCLFVAHGLLRILSALSVRDETVGGAHDRVHIGGPGGEQHLIVRFLSCVLLYLGWVV